MPDTLNILPTPDTSAADLQLSEQRYNDMENRNIESQRNDISSMFHTDTPVSLVNGQTINDLINQIDAIQAKTKNLANNININLNTPKQQPVFDISKAASQILGSLNNNPETTFNKQKQLVSLGSGEDLDRYKQSDYYNVFGYNPYIGKEQEFRYGEAMTIGDVLKKAGGGAMNLALQTGWEGVKGTGRILDSLISLDLSKLHGSPEELYQMAEDQQKIFDKYAIYDTAESAQGGLFNRQFFGNMLQQAGFAIGAGAEMWLEGVITGGIADFFLAPEYGLLASKMVGRLGETDEAIRVAAGLTERTSTIDKANKTFNKIGKMFTADEAINDMRKMSQQVTEASGISKKIGEFGKSLVPLYGTAENLIKLNKAGAGGLQLAVEGIGGIHRALSEINMARSESIFESASTYKQLHDKLVKDYIDANGQAPQGAELERIKKLSENASSDNFWVNMGVLSVMNRMQFSNMFKTFDGSRSIFSEGVHSLEDQAFEVTGKIAGKTEKRAFVKSPYFGKLAAIGEIAQEFGGKTAAWEATKTVGGRMFKMEGLEGLQEMIQNASDKGLEDYYYDLYHSQKGYGTTYLGNVMSKYDKIQNGFVDQIPFIGKDGVEGLKTFVMGAYTGALLSPMYKIIGITNQRFQDRKQLKNDPTYKTAQQRAKESVDLVNAFYTGDKTAFKKEWIASVKVQNKAAETMEEAAKNHDKYVFYNAKDSAFNKMVEASIKLNMFDSVRDHIKEMGAALKDDEEFKQAYGMEATKQNRGNVKAFMDKVANDLEDYHSLRTQLIDKYADLVMPELYRNNGKEVYENMKIAQSAVFDAIDILTFNIQKSRQSVLRAESIRKDLASIKSIGASSNNILIKAGNPTSIKDSINILQDEIKGMTIPNTTLSGEQRTLLSKKQEELNLLRKWENVHYDVMTGEYDSYTPDILKKEAYGVFKDLTNFYNKQNKNLSTISTQDSENAFIGVLDHMKLNRDEKSYIDAVNLLADPRNENLIIYAKAAAAAISVVNDRIHQEHLTAVNNTINAGEETETEEDVKTIGDYTIKQNQDKSFSVFDSEEKEIAKDLATHDDAEELINSIVKEANKQPPEQKQTSTQEKTLEEQKADIKRRQQEELNQTQKFTINRANKDLELAPEIELSEIDLEKSGLGDLQKAEVKRVRVLEYRGINSEGKRVGTVIIQTNDSIETFEVFFNDVKINSKYEAILAKLEKQEKPKKPEEPKGIIYLDPESNEFKQEYNNALDKLASVVNQPNATPSAIKAAFDDLFNNTLINLDPSLAARAAYKEKLKEEMDTLISEANRKIKANNVTGAKQSISNSFKNEESSTLNDIANDSENILDELNPEHKEEVIQHFETNFLQSIGKRISNLLSKASELAGGELLSFFKKSANEAKERVTKNLDKYKEESNKIKESINKSGIRISKININEFFDNPVNMSIQDDEKNRDKSATPGQLIAIDNLINSGILESNETNKSLQGASYYINQGVGRIYTIEINKLVNSYFKLKNSKTSNTTEVNNALTSLKASVKSYLESFSTDPKEDVQAAFDAIEKANDPDELLGIYDNEGNSKPLQVEKSNQKDLSDEEYKLLKEFRTSLYNMQFQGNLMNVHNNIEQAEQNALSNSERLRPEDLVTSDLINSIPNSLFKDSNTKNSLKNSIISLLDSIKDLNDKKEISSLINKLSIKEFKSGVKIEGEGIIKSIYATYLNTQTSINEEEQVGPVLSKEEMLTALENSKTTILNKAQINQVDEFAKTELLNAYKAKLNAAIGYSTKDSTYTPEKLGLNEEPGETFSTLRQKFAGDIRTAEDLKKDLNAQGDQVSTKNALNFIVNSDFATDAEKELARSLMNAISEDSFITLANNSDFKTPTAGDFDPNTNRIRINMNAVEHKDGYTSSPIETVILHELIHQLTETALSDPNSEFYKGISSLMAVVKKQKGADTFYAFQSKLSNDEQRHEFVAEALTNPAFQHLLASTQYANSKTSVWDKLLDIINRVLQAVGIDVRATALSEVLNLTGDLLNPVDPGSFVEAQSITRSITEAKTLDELKAIREDLFNNKDITKISEATFNSMINLISGKEKSINQMKIRDQYEKTHTAIKINNKIYHYKLNDNGRLSIVSLSSTGVNNVRSQKVIDSIINNILSKKDGVKTLLSKNTINDITQELNNLKDKNKINNLLKQSLGVKISDDIQTKIENKLFSQDIPVDQGLPETEVIENDVPAGGTTTTGSKSITEAEINKSTAQNLKGLRSFNSDGYIDRNTGDFIENPSFTKYYSKIRSIINALSIKDLSELKDYHVTIDKDNEHIRWDDSFEDPGVKNNLGIVGFISDEKGNPIVFNPKGEKVGVTDRNNLSDYKGLRNGENQIVYIYTINENKNKNKDNINPEEIKLIKAAKEEALKGNPQISRLTKINQGRANTKSNINKTSSQLKHTNEKDFVDKLSQDNVTFSLDLTPSDKEAGKTGGSLLVHINDSNGSVHTEALQAPKVGQVSISTKDGTFSLFEYAIDLMKTYRGMSEHMTKDELSYTQSNLKYFLQHVFFSKKINMGGEFKVIELITPENKQKGITKSVDSYFMFKKDKNGNYQTIDETSEAYKKVKKWINDSKLNVDKEWLQGRPFMFPIVKTDENGKKMITFVEKDYVNFLLKEVGFTTYMNDVPTVDNVKFYNSIVEFGKPENLNSTVQPTKLTEQNIVNNPNAVENEIKDTIQKIDASDIDLDSLPNLGNEENFRLVPANNKKIFNINCK